MKMRIAKYMNSSFIRNVAVMATGSVGAQVVTIILSPIITRLYGPEAFGIMGSFNALILIVIPIAALTYPVAIVLPKSNDDAKGLVKLSLIITGFITIFSFSLIMLFNNKIINIFDLGKIANYIYLIPIVVVFSGLMQVIEQWLIRTRQFKVSAQVNFAQSIIINSSKVFTGFIYPVATFLVVFTVLGNGLRSALMLAISNKKTFKENIKLKDIKMSKIKELAIEYKDFPLFRAPELFISKLSQGLPVLMLTVFFGPAYAGFYSIGKTVLSLPSRLIGQAIGDVFYPYITVAINNNKNVNKLIKKATFALFGIGVIPFGAVILFGPSIFSLVFGSDWQLAGEFARWIALWSFSNLINKPSVRSLPPLNAQRLHLLYTIFGLIIRTLMLIIGFYVYSSATVAVALFSLAGALLNIGLISVTLKRSKYIEEV